MATTNQALLPVTQLDFDGIKASLKEYLRGQSTFTDYDFEGSGLSVLLDLLAYNTHQIAFMNNMVARETFIDSAVTRQAVVGIAKQLGYTTRSIAASTAVVNVDFGLTAPDRVYVQVGDTFTATSGGNTFQFTALENFPIVRNATTLRYEAQNVRLWEGSLQFFSYLYDSSQGARDTQKFEIPNTNADTRTLKVRVQKSKTDSEGLEDLWERATNVVLVNSESKVYYLQENSQGRYEVYFGDNLAGKGLENGNLIVLQYLVTNGKDANGVGRRDSLSTPTFEYDADVEAVVTVSSPASGGDDQESIESIRYYAPLAYQAQLRAVTAEDYRAIIAREYGNVESVMVWGGEDSDPPQYGKVFVSLKPTSGANISDSEKLAIRNQILANKNLVSITPEIVDPDYLYLGFQTTVYYDPSKTIQNASGIENLVYNEILRYADEELDKFDRNFRYSKFAASIDDLSPAIKSNISQITLTKRFEPALGSRSSYKIKFLNSIFHPQDGYPPVVTSSGFGYTDPDDGASYDCFFDDDGSGNLRIYRILDQAKKIVVSSAGTVDYTTGEIEITNFVPAYIVPPFITDIAITVVPNSSDIESKRNQILTIDQDTLTTAINVTAVEETTRQNPYQTSGLPFPFDTV